MSRCFLGFGAYALHNLVNSVFVRSIEKGSMDDSAVFIHNSTHCGGVNAHVNSQNLAAEIGILFEWHIYFSGRR